MKNESEKKGLLGRLIGPKKAGKGSCCSFEIEEIPEMREDNEGKASEKNLKEMKKDS